MSSEKCLPSGSARSGSIADRKMLTSLGWRCERFSQNYGGLGACLFLSQVPDERQFPHLALIGLEQENQPDHEAG